MNKQDYEEAARDAFLVKAGVLSEAMAHPAITNFSGAVPIIPAMAALSVGDCEVASGRIEGKSRTISAGLTSSDFESALGDIVRHIALSSFKRNIEHRKFCSIAKVDNFKKHYFGSQYPVFDLLSNNEAEESQNLITSVFTNGLQSALLPFARTITLTHQALVNDEIGLIAGLALAAGFAASRVEQKQVYGILEANANLADGSPIFHADHSNLLTTNALSVTGLDAAIGALRDMSPGDNIKADLSPKYLIVPGNQQATASKTVKECGLDIGVFSSALVTSGWYLLADPQVCPVIGLIKPTGSLNEDFSVKPGKSIRNGGVSYRVTLDSGVTAMGRIGAVKSTP